MLPASTWIDLEMIIVSEVSQRKTNTRTYCIAQGTIGEGNGYPLQYSCLENPVDRGAWWAAGHRVAELDTTEVT